MGCVVVLVVCWGTPSAQQLMSDGFEESCFVDSDDDRLANCEEAVRNLDYNQPDTDGDGLRDGDEVLGTIDGLNLPAMGVNPRHKDLLVEMDWTDEAFECAQHSHRPLAETIEEVRVFYANIPVANVDGMPGINFIADYGQGGVFTGGNFIAVPDGITGQLDATFFQFKAANFVANRAGYFRYQLHGHRFAYNDPSSGCGDVLGDNSVVTLYCLISTDNIRNTIIHELGHNMGLEHGGDTICNNKRNYNSLMNYNNQFPGLDVTCDGYGDGKDLLGYSDGSRNPLINGQLNEALGICPLGHPAHQPIDWNSNGILETSATLPPGAVLAAKCFEWDRAFDHDDYEALHVSPLAPQGGGAPPPAATSGACAAPTGL